MRVIGRLSMVLAALVIAGAVTPAAQAQAPPRPGLGDQLFSLGGPVTITPQAAAAGISSELWIVSPEERFISLNQRTVDPVRPPVTIGPYPAGVELIFQIRVPSQGRFHTGPGERNPDDLPHAVVTPRPEGGFLVGFEDFFGGGDRDYDDNVFIFEGALAPNRPPTATDQTVQTVEDEPVAITLHGEDPDGGALEYAIAEGPDHGSLSGTAPDLTYTPAPGHSGGDTFTFTVTDARGDSATGTVQVVVAPLPNLSLADDGVTEGDVAEVAWTLDRPAPRAGSFLATTADGSAVAPADYQAVSVRVDVPVGATGGTISIPTVDDPQDEPAEALTVAATELVKLKPGDPQATVTITDNDRNGVFRCRASALQAPILGEPLVANAPNAPCHSAVAPLLNGVGTSRLLGLGLRADVLRAATTADADGDGAASEAGVARLTISLPGLTIAAEGLTSSARARCIDGQSRSTGSAAVARLTINGRSIAVTGPVTIPLGVATLSLEQVTTSGGEQVARALALDVLGTSGDVVVAESRVGTTGDPCQV